MKLVGYMTTTKWMMASFLVNCFFTLSGDSCSAQAQSQLIVCTHKNNVDVIVPLQSSLVLCFPVMTPNWLQTRSLESFVHHIS